MSELFEAIESLLEWMPICSKGSSGYLRAERVKSIVADMRKHREWCSANPSIGECDCPAKYPESGPSGEQVGP